MNAIDLRYRKQRVRVGNDRHDVLAMMRGRLILFKAFVLIAFAFMGMRTLDLMVLQSSDPEVVLEGPEIKPMQRADIVDRNGVLLATTLKAKSLYADPKKIIDVVRTAQKLSQIFPEYSQGSLVDRLSSDRRFVWVKRGVTPQEELEILQIGEPALSYVYEDKRFYPQGEITSHLIGKINRDGVGVLGVERGLNDVLMAEGNALETTIDVRVQHALRREISDAIHKFEAQAGAGLVMDIETGELLAAVSLPDFDPNNPPNPNAPSMFNRFSQGVYELGSTFKIFSTASLLEFVNVGMGQKFDAREPIKHGRFKIRDYHAEERILTLPEVFMFSSNIGSAKMSEMVGTERVQSFYKDLGLMDAPQFELKEVSAPLVPNPWREINTLTTSYGHGIAISPLQLVKAAASIVNGGYVVNPRLTFMPTDEYMTSLRVVSEKTSHNMRSLLRLAVTEGTGQTADVKGFLVGGKTGTAEKPSKDGRGYDRKRLISSFLGFFPSDAPRYAVFVMVDEPKGQKHSFGYATGGWVAAPAVGNVIESMASILAIKPKKIQKNQDPAYGLKRYVSDKGERY